jgi:hemoglobin-like flavoprotein
MFRLAVLLGLVAACVAQQVSHCCSADDRHNVMSQWKSMWSDTESSKVKIIFARRILQRVVADHPDVAGLFSRVDIDHPEGGAFAAHCMRVVNALDMVINLLDDPDAMNEALDHLADQHHVREGVKREHMQEFFQLLQRALPQMVDTYDGMSWRSCMRGVFDKLSSKLNA